MLRKLSLKLFMIVLMTTSALFLLQGCQSSPIRLQNSTISAEDLVKSTDPRLLDRCPELPVPASSVTPTSELLPMYGSLQGQYNSCAIKDDCLIAVITGETICFQPGKENGQSGNSSTKN